MLFDQLLESINQSETIIIPEGWGQGRAAFGGLVGAILVKKAQSVLADATKQFRSGYINFVGPVLVGEADLQADILREGNSVTGIQVKLIQNNQVQSTLVASFGNARDSVIQVAGQVASFLSAPADSREMPFIEGMTPEFFKHFDACWAEGDMPFSASKNPDFAGWMRFKPEEHVKKIKLPHVFALVDMWPPAVLSMFNRLAPASSLNWTLDLINMPHNMSGDMWWQYQVKTDFAADGYAYSQAHIWDEQGNLIAISRQAVTVFL
jgi:acyl-CoA thioesterase